MASQPNPDVLVAILAAGSSIRFGRPKQKELIRGVPMLRAVFDCVRDTLGIAPGVVTRDPGDLSRIFAPNETEIILNPRAREGIGTSIAAAADAAWRRGARALVIVLGDQPYLDRRLLETVVNASAEERIVAARYREDVVAPPVSFGSKFFPTLGRLTGDRGAKRIIDAFPQSVLFVDTASAFRDVDTPLDVPVLS